MAAYNHTHYLKIIKLKRRGCSLKSNFIIFTEI